MATAKKERRPKERKVKSLLVTRYEVSINKDRAAKQVKLRDPKNDIQRAIVFRAIDSGAETFEEICASCKKEVKSEASAETLARNFRWYLHHLIKDGLVLVSKKREAVVAS